MIGINTTSKNKHVGEIKRKIQHAKNQCRCITTDMKFNILPNSIIRALVIHAAMFMNSYQDKQGISQEFSPRELVLRWQLCTKKHIRAQFGSFCVTYDVPSPNETNRQDSRARYAICLGPTGNFQGTHKFLCLQSKRIIKRRDFNRIPGISDIACFARA